MKNIENKPTDKVVSENQQWYEKNKELLEVETQAMREYMPSAKNYIMRDGRMAWIVEYTVIIQGEKGRKYNLALVYNKDHPSLRYGQSVYVYLLNPTFEELRKMTIELDEGLPKILPHTFVDSSGNKCLSLSEPADSYMRGCTISALVYLRRTVRWINYFELGLKNPKIWKKFHGVL